MVVPLWLMCKDWQWGWSLFVKDQNVRWFKRSWNTFRVNPLLVSPSCIRTWTYFLKWQSVGGTARDMGTAMALRFPMSLSCVGMSHMSIRYHCWGEGGELLLLDIKDAFCVWREDSEDGGRQKESKKRSHSPESALILTSYMILSKSLISIRKWQK